MDQTPELIHLRRIRQHLGLSQARLAWAAGFDQPYVSNLEHGLRPRDPADIARLATALGVPIEALTSRQLTFTNTGELQYA